MSSPKEEQERVKSLLLDTVTLLCKNGLTFKKHLKVEGLLGITLDEENVFIVHFNENCGEVTVEVTNEDNGASKTVNARRNSSEHKSQKRKKRKSSSDYREPPEKIQLKTESDVIFLENDEDEDVKPFASQNFVPYQNSSTVFPNYGPIPMTPTQHLSPMIGLNNSVGQFTPGGVIGSAAQLPGPHTGMPNFSQDSSSLTTQMTPEKVCSSYCYPGDYVFSSSFHTRVRQPRRPRQPCLKKYVCNFSGCQRRYYEKRHMLEHQYLKHGRPRPSRQMPGKLTVWSPVGARQHIEPGEFHPHHLDLSASVAGAFTGVANATSGVGEYAAESQAEFPPAVNPVDGESLVVFSEPVSVIVNDGNSQEISGLKRDYEANKCRAIIRVQDVETDG